MGIRPRDGSGSNACGTPEAGRSPQARRHRSARSATQHWNLVKELDASARQTVLGGIRLLAQVCSTTRWPISHYRRQGKPIGSGVTEAACKTVFTQRLKQSGMRWEVRGGQVVLNLRVLKLSGVWREAFHSYQRSRSLPQFNQPGSQIRPTPQKLKKSRINAGAGSDDTRRRLHSHAERGNEVECGNEVNRSKCGRFFRMSHILVRQTILMSKSLPHGGETHRLETAVLTPCRSANRPPSTRERAGRSNAGQQVQGGAMSAQDILIIAASVHEGIGENRHLVERTTLIDRLGEIDDVWAEPARVEGDGAKGIAKNVFGCRH